MNAPVITFRTNSSPWSVVSTLTYQQTKDTLTGISFPVLAGESSDFVSFRIYNNFGLASNIADAYNVTITTFDDNSGSNASTKSVVFQDWLVVRETRVGEGASAPGSITDIFAQPPVPIGASSTYSLPYASSGSGAAFNLANGFPVGPSTIRAGSSNGGCGFAEIQSYLQVPVIAAAQQISFAIVAQYDWTS